ncbi:hypothetical protein ACP275_06G147900 [Erythranthe tilingii]
MINWKTTSFAGTKPTPRYKPTHTRYFHNSHIRSLIYQLLIAASILFIRAHRRKILWQWVNHFSPSSVIYFGFNFVMNKFSFLHVFIKPKRPPYFWVMSCFSFPFRVTLDSIC